jgi:hypothetical protein
MPLKLEKKTHGIIVVPKVDENTQLIKSAVSLST